MVNWLEKLNKSCHFVIHLNVFSYNIESNKDSSSSKLFIPFKCLQTDRLNVVFINNLLIDNIDKLCRQNTSTDNLLQYISGNQIMRKYVFCYTIILQQIVCFLRDELNKLLLIHLLFIGLSGKFVPTNLHNLINVY